MADDTSNDSALPPKLNLRKVAPATAPTPEPSTEAKPPVAPISVTAETMRITLPATDTPDPEAKPTPTLTSKPATPAGGPVRLSARLRPTVAGTSPKPLTPSGAAPRPVGVTPVAPKPFSPKPVVPKPVAPAPAEPEADESDRAALGETAAEAPHAVTPKSVKLKPVAVGIKRPGADPNAPAGSKRETSKIPLESATPSLGGSMSGTNTKTIKIAPAPVDSSRVSGAVGVSAGASGEPVNPDPKRQTSRISLEAALGTDENGKPGSTGPKTIRLKRPSEAPTVKVKKAEDAEEAGGELRKTAKIEMPPDEADTPATQRKTIKVKRPSQRRTVKSVSVKRGLETEGGAAAATSGAPSARPAAEPVVIDSAHWTFIMTAIAAMIVCFVLIYVLCAQVLGPNVSLTEVAYAAPDVELPWPGRIARQ